MKIALKFDPDLLRRYASNGRSLAFGISFENGGVHYPDDDWIDFGEVILAWWFAAILRLAEGADEDSLPFMEGPYAAGVRYDRESRMVRLWLEGRGGVAFPFR